MNNFQKKYKDNFLLCMFFDISMTPALMIYSWILPAIHQPQEMKWVKIDGKGQYKKFASLHICLVIPPKRAASKSRINTSPAFSAGRVSLLKPSYAFALE